MGPSRVLTNAHFSTICMLEAGLALIFAAARSSSALLVEQDDGATKVGLKDKRGARFVCRQNSWSPWCKV